MPAKREQAKTKSAKPATKAKANGHAESKSNGANGAGKANGAAAAIAIAPPRTFTSFSEIANFIWSVADLLRGDYKQADYGKVILPLTVLRRLDCVLADTKDKVLAKYESLKGGGLKNVDPILNRITGVPFHNVSKFDFVKLLGDSNQVAANLRHYIQGFSESARDVIDRFKFAEQITKLDESDLLYVVLKKFAEVDLHPASVPNHMMGSAFEELIRKFAEQSNETAGEHFTPREVIRLMVDLLFVEDDDALRKRGVVKTLFDCACGTGGMLSVAEEYLRELNPDAQLQVFGQELNDESWAICNADMMIKGQNPENVVRGNSFSEDGHVGKRFDYMLSNPPFGVEWKKVEKIVRDESESQGFAGRFGAGVPRINDGSLLFLQHMISKMKPANEGGSRLAIVFNGSPLFTGDAGSGESNIRQWIFENDWLEAIIALPTDMFFNTGIATYVWIVTNRKPKPRRKKVQLINGVELFQKMRKSLGNKRNELGEKHIEKITRTFGDFVESDISKIFDNDDFGYRQITVERPLRVSYAVTRERLQHLTQHPAFVALVVPKKKGGNTDIEVRRGESIQRGVLSALEALVPPESGTEAEQQRGCVCGHSFLNHQTRSGGSEQPCACGCSKFEARRPNLYMNRQTFIEAYTHFFRHGDAPVELDDDGVAIPAPVHKAILEVMGVRDERADVCTDSKGEPEPDSDLRDTENVPLTQDIRGYFERAVRPHVPDAWIDESRTKVGYEIPFTRHFYQYKPMRPLNEIDAEIRVLESEIQGLLGQVVG